MSRDYRSVILRYLRAYLNTKVLWSRRKCGRASSINVANVKDSTHNIITVNLRVSICIELSNGNARRKLSHLSQGVE